MSTQTFLPTGQHQARTRWKTHASGAAFDQKKTPYLTEHAQEFMAQQAMCVVAGMDAQHKLDGLLVLGQPGLVQVINQSTCLLKLEYGSRTSRLLKGLHTTRSTRQLAWLSLLFICHSTRERLCVQGTVESLSSPPSALLDSSPWQRSIVVQLHVEEAFFHCSKYVRTRIPGLTVPGTLSSQEQALPREILHSSKQGLSRELCRFLSQQRVCFLCTVNREGRCAVNHRGGAAGFLLPFLPHKVAQGGVVLLPDYAGNGAFEAIGNILETEQAALVVPDYVAQIALCLSGSAYVAEPKDLRAEVASRCVGAERIVALAVQRVEVQSGDWSATLAYECVRAQSLWAEASMPSLCPIG